MYLSLIYYNKVSFIEIDFKKKDGLIVTGYNHFVHGMFFAFFVFYYSWHKSNYQKKKIKVFISDLQERNFKFGDRFSKCICKNKKIQVIWLERYSKSFSNNLRIIVSSGKREN